MTSAAHPRVGSSLWSSPTSWLSSSFVSSAGTLRRNAMAREVTTKHKVIATTGAWIAGFLIFFPILWMVLASFKTELEAFAIPPSFLFFHWTTENYVTVQERSDYVHHALNSIIIAGGSTLIAMAIAIPAAWSMAFSPTKRTKDILLWMSLEIGRAHV